MSNQIELLDQAEAAIATKDYQQAIACYEKLINKKPNELSVIVNLSVLYAKLNRLPDAKQLLVSALEEQPDSAILTKQLANVLKNLGDDSQAEYYYLESIKLNNQDASSFNNLGLLYYQQNKLDQAERSFQQALALEPGYLAAMYNLALSYQAMGNTEQAIACLLGLLAADSTYTQAHFLLAKLALSGGDSDKASQYFYQVASLHPDNVEVLHSIAATLLEANQYQLAKPYYETIASLQNEDHLAHYNLGVIAEQCHDNQAAINYYQAALALNQDHFASLNNLGVTLLAEQKVGEAKRYFEKALALQSDNESICYTLAALSGDQTVARSPNTYIAKLFDQYAANFDDHLAKGLDYRVPGLLLAAVEAHLTKPAVILDLGCGTGLAGETFKSKASHLVGVDLSAKMLAIAEKKQIYQALIESELTAYLGDSIERYDLILAADVLVYFGELEPLFREVKARLAEGGLFAFSVESLEGEAYTLTQSGRFAHSLYYLNQLANKLNLKVLFSKQAITRTQNNKPVYGDIVVLKK